MQTVRTVSMSQCIKPGPTNTCFQPLRSTEFGGLSHAHSPHLQFQSANGLSYLQALIAGVTFDIQLCGLAIEEHAAASDMYGTQMRRSPSTTQGMLTRITLT